MCMSHDIPKKNKKKDKYLYRNTLVKIYNIATHNECHKYHKISWQPRGRTNLTSACVRAMRARRWSCALIGKRTPERALGMATEGSERPLEAVPAGRVARKRRNAVARNI